MSGENKYLNIVKNTGIKPTHEANTSRYVHEVIRHCLDWPMDAIVPQKSSRGYIDYLLTFPRQDVNIVVEVKKFGSRLKDDHIRKYLVKRGPKTHSFYAGVLTNLRQWHIYVSGSAVKKATGSRLIRVAEIEFDKRASIHRLRTLIGYRRNGALKQLRAAMGECEEVLRHLVLTDKQILKAVRESLRSIRDRHDPDASVPHFEHLSEYIWKLLNGKNVVDFPFTPAKLKQALRSKLVAEAADRRLVTLFGTRKRGGKVRRTIKDMVNVEVGR